MAYPDTIQTAETSEGDVNAEIGAIETIESPKYKVQTVTGAGPFTPDPTQGEIFIISTALAGATTINNPPAGAQRVGRRLVLRWSQDATGGRVVTLGNQFLGPLPATTLSKTFQTSWIWDGTNWAQTGSVQLN